MKWLGIFISIIVITPRVTAQTDLDTLLTSLSKQHSGRPAELVYLQTSKGIYETGEDLWFKAYQLDAQSFGLSNLSRTLYLQMVSSKDSIVWQEKYPIENGLSDGHVFLGENLPEGDYSLEAYTRHSFYNDSTEILSSRKVRVVKNIAQDSRQANNQKEDKFRFELFPEGGNLVLGTLSRLAFKATDGKGFPVDVEGVLFQDNKELLTFSSSHDGMGFLLFTPLPDKSYRIELKDGKSYSLPEIYPQGISLRLFRQNKDYLEFVISQTKDMPQQEVCLMGQVRGMVCCVAKGVLKNNMKIKLPLKEFLYQGIAEFTLFNGAMQPVAERLVYVHPEKKLRVSIKADKETYAIREKAFLSIKVTDERGNPVQANLGVCVFDKAYSNSADPVNIFTHCYLSSQIKGNIYNPAYYFDEENKDRLAAMDLLLLTQGWRRYVWGSGAAVYKGEMFLPDEISGVQTIPDKKKNKNLQGSQQLIQVSGAETNSLLVWADSVGRFTVDWDMMKALRGGYVYLKPMLSGEHKPSIDIKDYFTLIDSLRKGKPHFYQEVELSQHPTEQVLDLPVASKDSTILLDEVVVVRKARRVFRDKFMGRLDSLAQMDVGMPWVCPHGHLENYREGYTVHHDPRYCPNATIVPLEDRSKPIEGKAYRIIKPKYFDGGRWFIVEDEQTIIYHGPLYSEEELLRKNNLWRTKGYYAAREFYQPDEVDMQLPTPDARNTLLWQPSVVTDEKGEATVSFYCSDINTPFIGYVEGTDGLGLFGCEKYEFRVIRK